MTAGDPALPEPREPPLGEDAYRDILQTARRFARSADEARDLVQDALAIALARGFRDWPASAHRAWLRGVIRKRAAFLVRGQVRRRRREEAALGPEAAGEHPGREAPGSEGAGERGGRWSWQPGFLASLPRSLRAVAMLASADLCAAEIRWLLGLTDTALRQRLSALRRAVRAAAEAPTRPAPEPALTFGAHRASLLSVLRRHQGAALATHDPDGHAILLRLVPHKTWPLGNSRGKGDSTP